MSDAPKRISAKVKAAINALVLGDAKTITDAAAGAGLSREHLSRELGRPHITEFMKQKVARSLAVASARAGVVKAELLDCDNAMVRDRASSFILGLSGIRPAQDAQAPGERLQTPGMIIVIEGRTAEPKIIAPDTPARIPAGRTIEHQP